MRGRLSSCSQSSSIDQFRMNQCRDDDVCEDRSDPGVRVGFRTGDPRDFLDFSQSRDLAGDFAQEGVNQYVSMLESRGISERSEELGTGQLHAQFLVELPPQAGDPRFRPVRLSHRAKSGCRCPSCEQQAAFWRVSGSRRNFSTASRESRPDHGSCRSQFRNPCREPPMRAQDGARSFRTGNG